MIVGLTEAQHAEAVGVGRKREALRKGRGLSPAPYQDNGGTHDDRHALGAVAELAVALHFGVADYWREHQAFSLEHWKIKSDVGSNLHVRATDYPRGGMILHPYDPDGGAFVLAVVNGRDVSLVGWMRGAHAKDQKYWRDKGRGFGKRPAFVVPQSALLPIDTILPAADVL